MVDGWRGLAALAVVLHHVAAFRFDLGSPAVMLFFVISGYCIGRLRRIQRAPRRPFQGLHVEALSSHLPALCPVARVFCRHPFG